jgi:integrase
VCYEWLQGTAGGVGGSSGIDRSTGVPEFRRVRQRRKTFAASFNLAAGLSKLTFHDLRHTCASLLFQRSVQPTHIQELFGYASATITLDTYSAKRAAFIFTDVG